jgi:hypothetical protein
MKIQSPRKNRMKVIHDVYANDGDPDVLTPWEMAWLENLIMEKVLDKLSESNAMVFYGEEDGRLN